MHATSPHKPLTGRDNSTIKYLRSLQEHKYRKKENAFLIDGVKMVEEAIRDNLGVKLLAAAPTLLQHHGKGILKLAESRQIDVVWISEKLLDTLSENKSPQPVIAAVRMKQPSEESLIADPARLIVIAHELQDPGNLGTIIRTAEAVSASGVAITPNTVDPYNAKAIRASMGSILRLPVVPLVDISAFLKRCSTLGFQTAGTVLGGRKSHFETDFTQPTVLVFGQEGSGLPHDILNEIDLQIRIPMAETIDSLNVATAAAVVLYEAKRQRMQKGK